MKLSIVLSLCSLTATTSAHYVFGRLIFDNTWTQAWEYVRQVGPPEGSGGSPFDLLTSIQDPTSLGMRCGRNASSGSNLNKPKTATVKAGDKVGFAVSEPMLPDPRYNTPRIYHQGTASIWLSKAPSDDLNDYTGDGDWFKIFSMLEPTEQSMNWSLPENKIMYDEFYAQWGAYMLESVNATIPIYTPPGKYLLRMEHVYPNQADEGIGGAQFFLNCAHIEITNDGTDLRQPGPLVKLPGAYVWGQPDIYVNTYAEDFAFNNMVAPAPQVWTGQE